MKLINDVAKSGYIQSGNFMTSCLHDQTEYTVSFKFKCNLTAKKIVKSVCV